MGTTPSKWGKFQFVIEQDGSAMKHLEVLSSNFIRVIVYIVYPEFHVYLYPFLIHSFHFTTYNHLNIIWH